MSLTIRARLTIWYLLAFSAMLLLVLGVLAFKMNRNLDNEIKICQSPWSALLRVIRLIL